MRASVSTRNSMCITENHIVKRCIRARGRPCSDYTLPRTWPTTCATRHSLRNIVPALDNAGNSHQEEPLVRGKMRALCPLRTSHQNPRDLAPGEDQRGPLNETKISECKTRRTNDPIREGIDERVPQLPQGFQCTSLNIALLVKRCITALNEV